MKKTKLINLWKEIYNLDSKTVNMVLEFVFCLSKEKVFLLEEINPIYEGQIIFIFEKLLTWYPFEYISKKVSFMGLEFFVNENVLIPRDDTEVLVKEVINFIESKNIDDSEINSGWYLLIDIWTWTWIIPISITKNTNIEKIIAIDISKKAVEIAKENICRHNLEEKINLINMDFKEFDFAWFTWENIVITANLPYIKEGDFKNMDFSVYKFEPEIALYWWKKTWFELYENLIELFIEKTSLFNSLTMFIEIWFDQYEISKNYLLKKWLKFEFFKDTNNIHRVIRINIK